MKMASVEDSWYPLAGTSKAQLTVSPVEAKAVALLNSHIDFLTKPLCLIDVLSSEISDGKLVLLLHGSKIDLSILTGILRSNFPNLVIHLNLE